MEYLTAGQTLNIIEKLMIDSGTRNYCTDICKGICCEDCYTENKEACHLCEKRRLPCSIYLCRNITLLLDDKTNKKYRKLKNLITTEYCEFVKGNIYFHKPNKKYLEKARFPIEIKQLANTMTKGLTEAITQLKEK